MTLTRIPASPPTPPPVERWEVDQDETPDDRPLVIIEAPAPHPRRMGSIQVRFGSPTYITAAELREVSTAATEAADELERADG
jgi:hypothetical protein